MNKEWKDQLLQYATNRGLCGSYMNPMSKVETVAQAIRLYKNCPEWAIENQYPPLDWFRNVIGKDVCAENGFYIDTEFDGERIDRHICCIFHNCTGSISTGLNSAKQIIPMLYVASGSNLNVNVDDGINIPCYIFDNSVVKGNLVLKKSVKTNYDNYTPAKEIGRIITENVDL